MTNEERDLIIRFVQRFGGAQPGGFAGGVGQAAPPPLPPIDQEADALLADLFAHYPEARYRITQMAFVQEHALAEAQNRMQRLEWELQQARQQAQAAPAASPWGQPSQPQQSRGFFGSLLGGAQRQAPPPPPQYAPPPQPMPPPPPQYAPGYSPGMFQPRGSGFLGSALTTAAGVAGGMVAGNALMNLFSSGHGGMGGGGFMPGGNPWAAPASASPVVDPYDVGGAAKGAADSSGWTNADPQPAPDPSDWTTQPDADSSGWTDPGGDVPDAGGGSDDWS